MLKLASKLEEENDEDDYSSDEDEVVRSSAFKNLFKELKIKFDEEGRVVWSNVWRLN